MSSKQTAASATKPPPANSPSRNPSLPAWNETISHQFRWQIPRPRLVRLAWMSAPDTRMRLPAPFAIARWMRRISPISRLTLVGAVPPPDRPPPPSPPNNVPLPLNLAMIDLRESEFTAAMEPLDHARRIEPDSADVAKLMGWAYYGANKLDQAVAEWKRAQQLRPDEEVASALAKAERDRQEEAGYREGETSHFSLKYSGAAAPDLASAILHVLEDHFRDLESQLDYTPPERIGVILYTNEAFADITRAPGWAGAINDGRIRVPVQGLTSVTNDLSRVLKHELTHSFVGQKTRGRAPTWLQEGLAQWMEGRRSRDAASALVQIADKKAAEPFGQMEGSWMGLSGDSATYSYAWSLAAVESIIREGGMGDIEKLLDHIATEPSTELALRDSLRMSYADLAQQTTSYLRHEYLR